MIKYTQALDVDTLSPAPKQARSGHAAGRGQRTGRRSPPATPTPDPHPRPAAPHRRPSPTPRAGLSSPNATPETAQPEAAPENARSDAAPNGSTPDRTAQPPTEPRPNGPTPSRTQPGHDQPDAARNRSQTQMTNPDPTPTAIPGRQSEDHSRGKSSTPQNWTIRAFYSGAERHLDRSEIPGEWL